MSGKKIMDMIKENNITFVDLRFTDPRGRCSMSLNISTPLTKTV